MERAGLGVLSGYSHSLVVGSSGVYALAMSSTFDELTTNERGTAHRAG